MNYNPFELLENNLTSLIRKEFGEIRQMLPKTVIAPPKDRKGGKKLAMEVTGLSESSIYKKTMTKAIPCTRVGSRLLFSELELRKWMDLGMPHWGEYLASQRINEKLKK